MADDTGGGGGGPFYTKKVGPMPVWAWMAIAVGALLAVSTWQKNKAASTAEETAAVSTATVPDDLRPMYTFVDADTTLVSQNTTVAGRTRLPSKPPPTPTPTTTTPTPTPTTTTPTTTTPTTTTTEPAGRWVTIVKWTSGQKEGTPSTLWGVAKMVYGDGKFWNIIWNAPQNAALKAKRKNNERLIQPGDKVWVPT